MINITIHDRENKKAYRAHVTRAWAVRHDNGALISCGLTIDEPLGFAVPLTRRAFVSLQKTGRVTEISVEQANHSGCQSACVLRGAKECRW